MRQVLLLLKPPAFVLLRSAADVIDLPERRRLWTTASISKPLQMVCENVVSSKSYVNRVAGLQDALALLHGTSELRRQQLDVSEEPVLCGSSENTSEALGSMGLALLLEAHAELSELPELSRPSRRPCREHQRRVGSPKEMIGLRPQRNRRALASKAAAPRDLRFM